LTALRLISYLARHSCSYATPGSWNSSFTDILLHSGNSGKANDTPDFCCATKLHALQPRQMELQQKAQITPSIDELVYFGLTYAQ